MVLITRSCAGTQSSIAHALADEMQRTAAARADSAADVEQDILARQMIGQRLAMGLPLDRRFACERTAFLDASDIGVEVFQRERELVGIELLGAAAELRPLELFDDRLKSLDLSAAALDRSRHIAHESLQKLRVGRQILKIDQHDGIDHKQPQNPKDSRLFRNGRSADFSRRALASKLARERASRCPRSASQAGPASA